MSNCLLGSLLRTVHTACVEAITALRTGASPPGILLVVITSDRESVVFDIDIPLYCIMLLYSLYYAVVCSYYAVVFSYYGALCSYYAAVCLYYAVLWCCMLVLCCCMLAYNYVHMMYACSLFVTYSFYSFRGVDTHNGTSEIVFSKHIPPSACVGCRRVHGAHVPG